MGKFSNAMAGMAKSKTNNAPAAHKAKVQIRRNVMDAIGIVRVFDAFAGDGGMWRAVWSEARHYVGCDLEWYRDARLAYVADNRRVLRAIDLGEFNTFDLDAYGSPWEQALILADRRPVAAGEKIGLLLTEGSGLKLKMGGFPGALRMLAGIRAGAVGGGTGASRAELNDRAIAGLAKRMNCNVLNRWEAHGKTGTHMAYIGLVFEGKKIAPASEGEG